MSNKYSVTVRVDDDEKQMLEALKEYFRQKENISLTTTDVLRKAIRDTYNRIK